MRKCEKKKASKAVQVPEKPISITGLMGDNVIYHVEISHLSLRKRTKQLKKFLKRQSEEAKKPGKNPFTLY